MQTALRVSLAPGQKRHAVSSVPGALLVPGGASIVLGAAAARDGLVAPVAPTDRTCFAPRGACFADDGSLWVADTGHHRLLGWSRVPAEDNAPADHLVGQPTFLREGRNAKRDPGAATLNVPTGITACGAGLALADAWNHRVLIWHTRPLRMNQPADVVLGQQDFCAVEANRGSEHPEATTLFWPYGVAWDGVRLWVADTGNRRVLAWDGLPHHCGQPADLVLGQDGFSGRDENAGGAPDGRSMRWPHGIAFLRGGLCIADAGNNRVMIWRDTPRRDNQGCDAIIGQADASRVDHNQGDYWPSAAALNMPYAVFARGAWLAVADTASSRLLAWHADDIPGYGAPARLLAGQHDWEAKGDNRWQAPARDSVCWPFGLSGDARHALIADAGNNRVLLWRWSPEVAA